MQVKVINNQNQIIVQIESNETRNVATNYAMDIARKSCNFFAVYVDGKLDCFTESSDKFEFSKTI